MMPGVASGKKIPQNARAGLAPRLRAALTMSGSIWRIAE